MLATASKCGRRIVLRTLWASPPTDAGEALSPLIEPSRVALDRMRDRSTHEPRSGVQPEAGVIHSVNPGPERARGVP